MLADAPPEPTGRIEAARTFLRDVVVPAVHPRRVPLEIAAHAVGGEPIPFDEAVGRPFSTVSVGAAWGGRWDTTWFRMRADVPAAWAGAEVVALIHLGGREVVGFTAEALVWDRAGRPVQGLHHHHREYRLLPQAIGGEVLEWYVEAAANPIPPWDVADWPTLASDPGGDPLYALAQAELATADRAVEALAVDLRVLLQVAAHVPERQPEVLAAIEAGWAVINPDDVAGTSAAARQLLAPALARVSDSPHLITAVGHAHIDTAWLWPLRETRRKCARTFSNQLRLMERYPEHMFACSQAVQYQWIKDGYPHLYEQIMARVAEGRWLPVGGMWVEADANVPSGESLVRQLVLGKRFFADEFGVETHELWIPDVFGYSAALPQIAVQAGVTALVTQKMSWNDTNVFPHSTFWWEGHDGSRLLTHFPPANTYNGDVSVGELVASQHHYRDHDRLERSLYPFGYGDGGGGPTGSMLEAARREANLAGLPKLEIGSVDRFLDQARAEAGDLATWVGELYLEAHRATLTTHADVKVGNRRGEEALRAAELWCVAAGLDHRPELDRAWRLLLLHQFHDILPGSSIGWVYEDTRRDHATVAAAAEKVAAEARAVVAGRVGGPIVMNPSSYDRDEWVEVAPGEFVGMTVPGCGWAARPATGSAPAPGAAVSVGDGWMANDRLRVEWDGDGLLTSIQDLEAGREVLAEGERGNCFQLHEDHPHAFDAWEVERSYLDHVEDLTELQSLEVVERGPWRAAVRTVRPFGDSVITQVMRLTAGSRRLEFETEVDWQHRHHFLKVAFPVGVRSARATYEIQHGHVERPTIENTSWDQARFEVCGHRWADLSEPGYGVALLNDSKYGYDIRGHVMRLSLLRGPGFPDPEADRGHHRFAYALLPHQGDLRDGGRVVEEAEAFNLPLVVVPDIPGQGSVGHVVQGDQVGCVVAVDRPGVSVEAVKWADRDDGVIVRLCEVWGARGQARITLNLPFDRVVRTDLLERAVEEVPHDASAVTLFLRPFELVTLHFS